MSELWREVKRLYMLIIVLGLLVMTNLYVSDRRVQDLEKQVNTLGIAVKVAHGEAKQAQRTQGPYLPDPLKVVAR